MKNIKLVTQCLNELHTCITLSIMPLFEPRLIPPMLNNYITALDLIKKTFNSNSNMHAYCMLAWN